MINNIPIPYYQPPSPVYLSGLYVNGSKVQKCVTTRVTTRAHNNLPRYYFCINKIIYDAKLRFYPATALGFKISNRT